MLQQIIIPIVSVTLATISTFYAVRSALEKRQKEYLQKYSEEAEKRVNMIRDYEHLKRNYDGLSASIAALDKALDHRLDSLELDIREIKSLLNKRD